MHRLALLDHKYIWHPFTQMQDWLKEEPIVITRGTGPYLIDVYGRRFLDANSSIWTNLHGHNNPEINKAIRKQLSKIAHSSALGLANEPASILAARLIHAVNPSFIVDSAKTKLSKVFYSDDGATAMEVALKLAFEHARRAMGIEHPRFISLSNAYHGDTIGAVSLGHINLFHKSFSNLTFKTESIPAPYCYRCKFNKAKPEREDARLWRKCKEECLIEIEKKFLKAKNSGRPFTAFVFEPLIQGAAGMIPQPHGWLKVASNIAKSFGALLIADEVLTGFGRACSTITREKQYSRCLFASHQADVQPDIMAVAKGITGGYLPLAATFTTMKIFESFLGKYEQFKTFFHGHSYTANQLGCAAALASLDLLVSKDCYNTRKKLEIELDKHLSSLWQLSHVGDIRRVGMIVGVELVQSWQTRAEYPLQLQAGIRVCKKMREYGVITRPVGNVIVLMPPFVCSNTHIQFMINALFKAIKDVLGN